MTRGCPVPLAVSTSSCTTMPAPQTLIFLVVGTIVVMWLLLRPRSYVPEDTGPEPVFRQRLVAVGDMHGDIHNVRRVLRMMKLADSSDSWTGGNDIFVQTGDIVDRGTYALDIYQLMQQLRSQAHSAGGRVVSILGNHEMMNALRDWRYVSDEDIAHWGGLEKREQEMSMDGWLGQEWLANYTVTALVPLAPYKSAPKLSFTHGSLRPSYKDLTPYPKAINDLGRSLLERALSPPLARPHPPYPYEGMPVGTTQDEIDLYSSGGPLWWRGLSEVENEKTVCAWAKELQKKTGAKRIIGGHTPNLEKIIHRCDGSIIIIDTGISSAYGGILSALEIIYTLTPANGTAVQNADGRQAAFSGPTKGERYLEREEVYAVYEGRRDRIASDEQEITL